MLTYQFCEQLIAKGYLRPFVGRRFKASIYVRWDPPNYRFVVCQAWKRWDPDTQNTTWQRAHVKDFAYVYHDRTEIFDTPGPSELLHSFAVSYGKPTTKKIRTTQWNYNGQIEYGDLPITLKNGSISTSGKVLERQVDAKKLKQYNAVVKNVMNIVTARVKLGVWENSDIRSGDNPRLRYPSEDIPALWALIKSVNENDLESVERLMEIAHAFSYDYEARDKRNFGSLHSIRFLKNFFARFKDRILEHLGALEYR